MKLMSLMSFLRKRAVIEVPLTTLTIVTNDIDDIYE